MPTGTPYEPEDGSGALVEQLSGMGFTYADISAFLGISINTLKKHHGGDLKAAYAKLHARLATRAVSMALAGDKTMLCFVLKTKFGWREKDREPATDGTAAIAGDTDPEVADRGDPAP